MAKSPDYLYTPDIDIDRRYPLKRVDYPIIGVVNQHESRELRPHDALVITLLPSIQSAQKIAEGSSDG